MMPLIKVLVVDDSALIRQILTRALAMDPRLDVVGTARNGLEAIEKSEELRPDVITLDIEMPVLNGLEVLPFLMRDTDARVIMLSSVDDPATTYEALAAGAVDFIPKPKSGFASSISDLTDVLLKQIMTAYRVAPEKRLGHGAGLVADLVESGDVPPRRVMTGPNAGPVGTVVAIAASTGGPPALECLFSGLTADLPCAFVIVQHLPSGFTDSLVERLQRVTDVRVRVGDKHAVLEPGSAFVAPHGYHMTVTRNGSAARIKLEEGPSIHGVKPAADPLIESVAHGFGSNSVGVLLTGMGSDGAEGLSAVAESGGRTIVQDEPSSVVWGMPGAAVRIGAAQRVVPLGEVAMEIRRAVRGGI
jgi:two-component system chemotaxis response regulator CheB